MQTHFIIFELIVLFQYHEKQVDVYTFSNFSKHNDPITIDTFWNLYCRCIIEDYELMDHNCLTFSQTYSLCWRQLGKLSRRQYLACSLNGKIALKFTIFDFADLFRILLTLELISWVSFQNQSLQKCFWHCVF